MPDYLELTRRVVSVTWSEEELSRFLLALDHIIGGGNVDINDIDIVGDFYNELSETLGEE